MRRIDLGLVVNLELVALQSQPELVLQPQRFAKLACHVLVKHFAAASRLLCRVHRDVRVPDQLVALSGSARVGDDANARPDRQVVAGEPHGLGKALQEPSREDDRLRLARSLEQQPEFVPAESRERVARTTRAAKTFGDLLKQLVADIVSETVVHSLEAVEVDQHDREDVLRPFGPRQRLIHAVTEQGAVGQAGQAVMKGLLGELLLEAHALGHIARVQDHAPDIAVAAEVGHMRLEVSPLAELVHHAEQNLAGASRRARGPNGRAVFVVHEAGKAVTEKILLPPIQHARHRLARIATTTGAEDQDQVSRGRDEASEVGGLASCGSDEGVGEEQ